MRNRGYGSEALRLIIQLARESGKYDFMVLDCHPDNKRAWHVYEKAGFRDTGEMENRREGFRPASGSVKAYVQNTHRRPLRFRF